jgi:hypothetical protein
MEALTDTDIGINVVDIGAGNKVQRVAYIVREAPVVTATGFTAASNPRRVQASGVLRPTNFRINYKNENIRPRPNVIWGFASPFCTLVEDSEHTCLPDESTCVIGYDWETITVTSGGSAVNLPPISAEAARAGIALKDAAAIAAAGCDDGYYGKQLLFRSVPGPDKLSRRPASAPQRIDVAATPDVFFTELGLSVNNRGRAISSRPKDVEFLVNDRWVRAPRETGQYEVRLKNNARHNPRQVDNQNSGSPASPSIRVEFTQTLNDRQRPDGGAITLIRAVDYEGYVWGRLAPNTAATGTPSNVQLPEVNVNDGNWTNLTTLRFEIMGDVGPLNVNGSCFDLTVTGPAGVTFPYTPSFGATALVKGTPAVPAGDSTPAVAATPSILTVSLGAGVFAAGEFTVALGLKMTGTGADAKPANEDLLDRFHSPAGGTLSVAVKAVAGTAEVTGAISGTAGTALPATALLTVNLADAEFIETSLVGLITVQGLPAGVAAGTITRVSATRATVLLTGTTTAALTSTNLGVTVTAGATTGTTPTIAVAASASATITMAAGPPLTPQQQVDAVRDMIAATPGGSTNTASSSANFAEAAELNATQVQNAARTRVNALLVGWDDMSGTTYAATRNGITVTIAAASASITVAGGTATVAVTISGAGGTTARTVTFTVTGTQS